MTSFVLRSFDLPPIEHEKKTTKCSNNNSVYPKSNNIMFDSRVCRGSTLKPDAVFRQQNALKILELKRDKKGHRRKVSVPI
jgi:phosphoenolpyruvate synthase/pyruvate phosphate dikinase